MPELPNHTDYYLTLKRQHKELALQDCVTFLDALPFAEVMSHYRTADIFVLSERLKLIEQVPGRVTSA